MKLNEHDLAQLIRVGAVVRHADGHLYEITAFERDGRLLTMPLQLRRLCSDVPLDSTADQITAALVPIERGREPPRGSQAFAGWRRAA